MNDDIRSQLENNILPFGEMPREMQEAFIVATILDNEPWLLLCYKGMEWRTENTKPTFSALATYRLRSKPKITPQYPWHVIDKQFNYAAIDSYGDLFLFNRDVAIAGEMSWNWHSAIVRKNVLVFERGDLPWQETLQKRPEGV